MPPLAAVRAANAAYKVSYTPVALFVGGTSGIGEAMVKRLASLTNGNVHIIICGRNKKAAEDIIATLPPTTGAGKYEFVACDATLMKNVVATSRELIAKLPKLNYLVLSPGYLTFKGRDETVEGIDRCLALRYYCRWKFIDELMPLLEKSVESGEDARVLSVLAAGRGKAIDLQDLGLKKSGSFVATIGAAPTYTDLMIEELAKKHPKMAFTHILPGVVRTPIFTTGPWLIRIGYPFLYPFLTTPDDCAEYMLYALLNEKFKNGAFRKSAQAEDLPQSQHVNDEAIEKLWAHSVQATNVE